MNNPDNLYKTDDALDSRLRHMMHKGALQAPPSPWFTQNVLHRLPERKRCIASVVEYIIYVLGIVATSTYLVMYVVGTVERSVVTVNDVIIYAVLMALLVSLCYMLVVPFWRRLSIS